jgi:hypothetical protein
MTSLGDGIDPRLDEIEFLAKADERHHDFRDDRRASRFRRLDGSLEDGAGLHLGNLRVGDRQTAAAMAEHRVELVQLIDALGAAARPRPHDAGDFGDFLVVLRQELVQRRIEQADGDRQAGHDLEQLVKSDRAASAELGQRRCGAWSSSGEDHLAHGGCGRRQRTCARCGKGRCPRRRRSARRGHRRGFRRWCGPHPPGRVGPFHDRPKSPDSSGCMHGDSALAAPAGGAINGDDVAGLERCAMGDQRAVARVDAQATGAGDAGVPMPRATTAAWLVMPPRWSECLRRRACRECLPGWFQPAPE